jgi:hypothetical protein
MLGMTDGFAVLGHRTGGARVLDCMSGGVALAWATEALQRAMSPWTIP